MAENAETACTAGVRATGGRDGLSRSSDGMAGRPASAARRTRAVMPADPVIDAEADLDRDAAHRNCPCSKAARGNIPVETSPV